MCSAQSTPAAGSPAAQPNQPAAHAQRTRRAALQAGPAGGVNDVVHLPALLRLLRPPGVKHQAVAAPHRLLQLQRHGAARDLARAGEGQR